MYNHYRDLARYDSTSTARNTNSHYRGEDTNGIQLLSQSERGMLPESGDSYLHLGFKGQGRTKNIYTIYAHTPWRWTVVAEAPSGASNHIGKRPCVPFTIFTIPNFGQMRLVSFIYFFSLSPNFTTTRTSSSLSEMEEWRRQRPCSTLMLWDISCANINYLFLKEKKCWKSFELWS